MSHNERVVVLVDMDCFYCQVEEKLNPSLKGKPLAVVQYNAWKGGGIIAVNYPARERGVTRHMRGNEAQAKCPEIELVRVPTVREKADLTKYREAGKSVAKVLQTFTPLLERASVDEAYLDITEAVKSRSSNTFNEISLSQIKNTHVVGYDTMEFLYSLYNNLYIENNLRLAFGGVIVEEIRAAVYEQTGYTCSAGIAHNKTLAKLVCGLNKPNKQTILPENSIPELYQSLPVRKIRSLGGKFGLSLSEDLGITNMADLLKFTEKELKRHYDEKTAMWLYNIARGINLDPVTTRLTSKSIGCCKKFPGKSALSDTDSVQHWLNELGCEIVERLNKDLEENNRKAKHIVISFTQGIKGKKDVPSSRTCTLKQYNSEKISADAFEIIKKHCLKPTGTFCIKYLGISAGKFEDCRNVNEITSFFKVNEKFNTNDNREIKQIQINNGEDLYAKEYPATERSPVSSDATEVLDENSSEFVFLDKNVNDNQDISDSDSISDELCNKSNEIQQQRPSFFLQYFENKKNQSRDFNTSRILEEHTEDADKLTNSDTEMANDYNVASTSKLHKNADLIDAPNDEFVENTTEICKECDQRIPIGDIISHMDYHLAIKIVREESHLYKNNPLRSPKQTKEKNKSKKRKAFDVEESASLKTFFKNNIHENDDFTSDTKICPQCNKKIDAVDYENHLDYHVAKKLHMEINPVQSCGTENSEIKKTLKTKNAKSGNKVNTSVRAYFKPLINN